MHLQGQFSDCWRRESLMLWSLGKRGAHLYFHKVIKRSDTSKAQSMILHLPGFLLDLQMMHKSCALSGLHLKEFDLVMV